MNNLKLLALITLLFAALAGCDIDEGGPEEIGENIEEQADRIGNSVEDACEDVKEGVNADDTDC